MSTLGDVTAPKIDQGGPPEVDEFIYVDISSIDNKLKRIIEPKRLSARAAPSRARQRLKAGDVLVSMTRPNLNAVAIVPSELDGSVGSTGFHVLRAQEGVEPRWLFNAVQTRDFVETMSSFVQGALYPAVRPKDIRGFEIHLPPIEDQRKILDEIETQFSRLDEAVANLKRVKANLKRYKAAVLKAAVEGHLVPTEAELARREGRSYETGAQLLQRILETRRNQWKGRGKYKDAIGAELSQTVDVPDGWTVASLDQLAGRITSGSRDWSPYYNRGTSIFVLAQNVRSLAPDFSMQQLVDPPKDDPSRDRSRIETGDLLATIVGANTGQVCLVGAAPEDAYVCQSVALIRPVASGVSAYLNYWLNSDEHGQRYFERCMYGQGRPHLSFEQLMTTPIALPPAVEQHRIVAELDRRLSLVRGVEAEMEANLNRAQTLRHAVLARQFLIDRSWSTESKES